MKQWYQLLLERGLNHTSDDHDAPPVLVPSRLEESSPATDFSTSYRMTRLFGLSPDQSLPTCTGQTKTAEEESKE